MNREEESSQQGDVPAYQYSIIPDHVEEGMLDDPRLQVLVSCLGMPIVTPRVRLKWSGAQIGKSFREYEVEVFGIKLSYLPNPSLVDMWLPYRDGYVHVWLYRVRWKGTKAVYEGIWLPGDDSGSWAISIRDLHLVDEGFRKRDCARLLRGSDLILSIENAGRPKGTGLFKNSADFHSALWDIFGQFSEKPAETEVIERIRLHDLCQLRESSASLENQTRTLRDWIKKAGFRDFHHAWREYLSQKTGK